VNSWVGYSKAGTAAAVIARPVDGSRRRSGRRRGATSVGQLWQRSIMGVATDGSVLTAAMLSATCLDA
jgi:hypothetical protein